MLLIGGDSNAFEGRCTMFEVVDRICCDPFNPPQALHAPLVHLTELEITFAHIIASVDQSFINVLTKTVERMASIVSIMEAKKDALLSPPRRLERLHCPEVELPGSIVHSILASEVVIERLRIADLNLSLTLHAGIYSKSESIVFMLSSHRFVHLEVGVFLGVGNTKIQLPALNTDNVPSTMCSSIVFRI